MFKKNIDNLIIILNIIFFSYYAIQLLIFTDEFAMNNLGFFNHAVAGLSEIVGIIFVTFVLAYIIIMFRGIEKQLPFIFSIFMLICVSYLLRFGIILPILDIELF